MKKKEFERKKNNSFFRMLNYRLPLPSRGTRVPYSPGSTNIGGDNGEHITSSERSNSKFFGVLPDSTHRDRLPKPEWGKRDVFWRKLAWRWERRGSVHQLIAGERAIWWEGGQAHLISGGLSGVGLIFERVDGERSDLPTCRAWAGRRMPHLMGSSRRIRKWNVWNYIGGFLRLIPGLWWEISLVKVESQANGRNISWEFYLSLNLEFCFEDFNSEHHLIARRYIYILKLNYY